MKFYDPILRFILAIAFFTFVPFLHQYPLLITIFSAVGIYLIITATARLMGKSGKK